MTKLFTYHQYEKLLLLALMIILNILPVGSKSSSVIMSSYNRRLRPIEILYTKPRNLILQTHQMNFKHREFSNIQLVMFPILHIGEISFFEHLQDRLADFDVVLYELITSRKNSRLERGLAHRR